MTVMGGRSDVLEAAEFVAAKLRWQLALLCDTSLSSSARLFGAMLMHDFDDRRGGCAWRAQGRRSEPSGAEAANGSRQRPREDSYRTRLGVDVRTVQKAAQELESAGYLQIERGRGRSHSNRYWPLFEKVSLTPPFIEKANGASPFGTAEKAALMPPLEAEKANPRAQKGGQGFAQHLQDLNKSPLPPSAATETPVGLAGHRRAALAAGPAPVFDADLPWVGMPRELRDAFATDPRLGEAWARSWLDPSAWDAETRTLVPRTHLAFGRIKGDAATVLKELAITVGDPRGRRQ